MVYVGTQYYRPPFPESKYWEQDIEDMVDAGLNAIQLWVVWAWVESKPGQYTFDDYDRIIELAEKAGLGVVLSTIAAIHPYWIHNLEPGSEMVTSEGHKVISSNRGECHYGLTPGGCFDHPGVWNRMKSFIQATVRQYRNSTALIGWDAWNELRWNVQADGLVCYCQNTLNSYRRWLDEKYDGLEGLNESWKRRYGSWEEVFPGKRPDRPYTDMMAFQEFISERSVKHAYDRYDTVKELDAERDVTVHGGQPTVLHGYDTFPENTSLHRGNDWDFADHVDGIGCSSFPLWGGREMSPIDVHNRFEILRSAAGDKKKWLSELQGGRYNIGFNVGQSVDAVRQQRWIWNGYAIGADKVLFWCWRDEVFGRESNGFGFAGYDGLREDRFQGMRKTGRLIKSHGELLEAYQPDRPEIGIFFSPQTYYLYWSQENSAARVLECIRGYAQALTESAIPFDVIEENHLDRLNHIKVLFLPRTHCMSETVAEKLIAWVKAGGRMIAETETGAFTPVGLYRYPEDRLFVKATGVREIGRRRLEESAVTVDVNGERFKLSCEDWITPMISKTSDDESLVQTASLGKGGITFIGTFLKSAPNETGTIDPIFGKMVTHCATSHDVKAPVILADQGQSGRFPFFSKVGKSGDTTVVFLFLPDADTEYTVAFDSDRFPDDSAKELITDTSVSVVDGTAIIPPTPWGVAVITF